MPGDFLYIGVKKENKTITMTHDFVSLQQQQLFKPKSMVIAARAIDKRYCGLVWGKWGRGIVAKAGRKWDKVEKYYPVIGGRKSFFFCNCSIYKQKFNNNHVATFNITHVPTVNKTPVTLPNKNQVPLPKKNNELLLKQQACKRKREIEEEERKKRGLMLRAEKEKEEKVWGKIVTPSCTTPLQAIVEKYDRPAPSNQMIFPIVPQKQIENCEDKVEAQEFGDIDLCV